MKKFLALFLLALTAIGTRAQNTTTVGLEDNSTPWWTAFSDYYDVPAGATLHLEFTNYSSKQQNWHTWLALAANAERGAEGYYEYFALRADNWAWGDGKDTDANGTNYWGADAVTLTSNYNWDTFKEDMDGAKVVMEVTNDATANKITLVATATTTGGAVFTETFTKNQANFATAVADPIKFFLTVEGGHLVIDNTKTSVSKPAAPASGFKNFAAIVNNATGSFLTADEQVQGTTFSFGVAISDDGTITRVAADDASSVATISGKFHSDHGSTNLSVTAPVDVPVKILVGQCTYSSSAIVVTNSTGETVATKTPVSPACWKNDPNNFDIIYYTGEATTLTITGMSYCPFISIIKLTDEEIAALNATYTLTYYNIDGSVIGTQQAKGQQPIGEFAFTVDKVTVADGYAFRGWFDKADGGKKYQTSDKVEGDMALYAVVTAKEVADHKSAYAYTLADANFDPADHECISITGGSYYNTHGWTFAAGNTIQLMVGGDATINIGGCAYSSGKDITITDAEGKTLGTISGKNDTDGGINTFEYEGDATTLTLTFSDRDYIHSVAIINHSKGADEPKELATLDNEPVTATFAFNLGTEGQTADFGETAKYFVTSKVTYGDNLVLKGLDANGLGKTQFDPLTQQNEQSGGTAADESNAIRFLIQPNFGLTFTPKKVSLRTTRFGTGNGLIDVSWQNADKTTVQLAQGVKPARNNETTPYSALAYDIEGATPGEGTCGLLINLYHLQNGKQIGFSDIVIEGTLSGTEKDVPVLATVTVNGTEFNVDKLFGDSYETTMELTKKVMMVGQDNPITAKASKGELGTISYAGDATKCTVTIPMTYGTTSVQYVLNLVQKPDFKLTYIDTDKKTVLGEFIREKDEAIGNFDIDYATATAEEGYKVRGWYTKTIGEVKYQATDIVTGDISLYAVATEIEVPSTYKKYTFDLTNKLFDAADHEAFNPQGEGYYWHDAQHGWAFKTGNKIDLLVGSKAIISVTLCRYGSADGITITDAAGKEIGSLPGKNNEDVDGEIVAFNYEGEGGTITLNLNTTGEMYIHGVRIVNTTETNYESQGNWYFVKAGNAESLLEVLDVVNGKNSTKDADRSYIFLPNGVYDLNETVKTPVSGHNISIIGQSMDGTVIRTAPDRSIEGLGSADMFAVSGTNLYLQDLTLQNALDYYGALSGGQVGGRAAVMQDSGNRTVGKRVKMLSYQDTYYSSNAAMQSYYEDCDIHGTVDFICGGGDVRFQNSTISLEPRNANGSGGRTVVAPSGTVKFGYVFDGCKVVDLAEGKGDWNLGRTWNNQPITVYLNTTLDENAQKTLVSSRWTQKGMNSKDPVVFGEFNTMDINGQDITPATNIIHSHGGDFETILTAEQAANYSYAMMFAENLEKPWDPAALTQQVAAPTATYDNGTVTWSAVEGATGYALFKNGEFVAITDGTSFNITIDPVADGLRIRSANQMGGFGEEAAVGGTNAISTVKAANTQETVYNLNGQRVSKAAKGLYIIGGRKVVVK